ncbi:hypothetical protein M0765_007860 [Variovorax sp. S2]|uniref:hypothetical protein n=1 Tax=Variovorax sp. S12S4 TaxID=3029170 RepID=UPI00215BCF5A|nr:hypothetical protein [Variovorax sp. S12S4]MCR8957639.1 hypothetical protein [Variovorax sp. S12S4]
MQFEIESVASSGFGMILDRASAMNHSGIFFLVFSAVLPACTYSSINPDAALADIRANNGYDELRDVEPGTARLILRASGSGYPAHFSVSTSPQACQNFALLGNVAYAGRGIVYPWIANAVQRGRRTEPYLVHEAKPGEPIQVRGHGSWADGTGSGYRSGHCGPVTAKFVPQDGHAYTVDFVWGNKPACSLSVMDATDPDAPVSISVEAIEGCPAPLR